MKKIITLLSFVLFISSVSFAQSDAAYEKSLKKMFKVSGSSETFSTVIKQMMGMMRAQHADIDNEIWSAFEKEMLDTSMDDLVVQLVPVYKKHLSIEDIKGIIAFYETPVGKKYAKKTPLITEGSMEVGQVWGMGIAQKIQEKLEEKGY